MSNKIFEALLSEKIEYFIRSFSDLTSKLFYDDEQGKLIHPAEYGMFRESVCKEFLRFIVPRSLEIDQGFIISDNNKISTQCDILIFDSNSTPLIENSDRQRFYPIETVCAVGEVKSTLNKTQFKKAIQKLSKVKPFKSELISPFIIKSDRETFEPLKNQNDNLCTFLVCQKLDFNLDEISNELDTIYESVEVKNRHNIILSIEDGVLLYSNKNSTEPYPIINGLTLKNRFIKANKANIHLKIFASNLFLTTSSATILFPELGSYMENNTSDVQIIDEKK